MRILFMGTTVFSCVVLQALLDTEHEVIGVVTQPDRPVGRKRVLTPPPVKELALEKGLDILQPLKIRDALDQITAMKPDCIVTCAYGQIVPESILNIPPLRCLNVHASLLPKYRGGAPIHWSIIKGETETGVTLMFMDKGMDSGDMLAKRAVTIDFEDSFGDVEAKLMEASKVLIAVDLMAYFKGELTAEKQDLSAVSYGYAIQRGDEFVSFKQEGLAVYNHIRGLIPWPVGYGILNGTNIKFHGVRFIKETHQLASGEVVDFTEDGLKVAVSGGYVLLTSLQVAGKPKQTNRDLINGVGRLWRGSRFE